jgi:hypothetical protein
MLTMCTLAQVIQTIDSKKTHAWEVTNLVDLFHTTTKVTTSNLDENPANRATGQPSPVSC